MAAKLAPLPGVATCLLKLEQDAAARTEGSIDGSADGSVDDSAAVVMVVYQNERLRKRMLSYLPAELPRDGVCPWSSDSAGLLPVAFRAQSWFV